MPQVDDQALALHLRWGTWLPMKTRNVIGLAVAATVGGAAALSWALWIWLAFSGAASEATGQRPVITSESELIDRTGIARWRSMSRPGGRGPITGSVVPLNWPAERS
ncbi:MAG TPA: hypothetical protein VFG47_22445 [Geminicoccaceae bacterium]|nr:hypothetical protein [Geminicoccaceae bacterium]